MDIYLASSQLGKYPSLFTSTSVNNIVKYRSDGVKHTLVIFDYL